MDFISFREWLIETKGMKTKTAIDIISRLKRVQNLIKTNNIDKTEISNLQRIQEYQKCSVSVRSQLKRAIVLADEFNQKY